MTSTSHQTAKEHAQAIIEYWKGQGYPKIKATPYAYEVRGHEYWAVRTNTINGVPPEGQLPIKKIRLIEIKENELDKECPFQIIADEVCKKHKMTFKRFMAKSRVMSLVNARKEFYIRCRDELGATVKDIAHFAKVDHTTVLHHLKS